MYGNFLTHFDILPDSVFKNVKATQSNLRLKAKAHVERTKGFQKNSIEMNDILLTFLLYLVEFEPNEIGMGLNFALCFSL